MQFIRNTHAEIDNETTEITHRIYFLICCYISSCVTCIYILELINKYCNKWTYVYTNSLERQELKCNIYIKIFWPFSWPVDGCLSPHLRKGTPTNVLIAHF